MNKSLLLGSFTVRKKALTAGMALCMSGSAALAGNVISASDITLSGGMTAGYFETNNFGAEDQGNYRVSDFMLELSGDANKQVSFVGAFGVMDGITVMEGNRLKNDEPSPLTGKKSLYPYGFQYGWLTLKPIKNVSIDVGRLATKVGYEVAPSYANPHATIAALWNGQPVYYNGIRANYEAGGLTFYAEVNDDALGTATSAWATGVSGNAGSVDYALSYYKYNGYKDLVDVIVSSEIAGMAVALNFDYHKLNNVAAGVDDSAYGAAFYITPSFGNVDVPVRVEYLNDGTSGVYGGVGTATTYTITPTYNFADNTFVRAEVSFVKSDNNFFKNDNGVTNKSSKTSFAVQAGVRF